MRRSSEIVLAGPSRPCWQEIPGLFGDVIAVLTDPAAACIDGLRSTGDVPEHPTKPAHQFAPDIGVKRQPLEDRRSAQWR